jgi:survival motor neuron (SMN) interacting protein 1 (SIP1)
MGPELPKTGVSSSEDGHFPERQLSPQEAYTRRLLVMFEEQKEAIKSIDASKAREQDHAKKPLGLDALRHIIVKQDPKPSLLSTLTQSQIFRMLRHATPMLKRGRNIDERLSTWLWGLLSALDERGTLDGDAVSIVRELGKKAVWIGIGFFNEDAARITRDLVTFAESTDPVPDEEDLPEEIAPETEALVEDGDLPDHASEVSEGAAMDLEDPEELSDREDTGNQNPRRNTSSPAPQDPDTLSPVKVNNPENADRALDELERAKKSLLRALKESEALQNGDDIATEPESSSAPACPDMNTRATLDAVITIVGEVYGQRDLLEFRGIWGGENGLWG